MVHRQQESYYYYYGIFSPAGETLVLTWSRYFLKITTVNICGLKDLHINIIQIRQTVHLPQFSCLGHEWWELLLKASTLLADKEALEEEGDEEDLKDWLWFILSISLEYA